jgi:ArsR family transcriptional regulator
MSNKSYANFFINFANKNRLGIIMSLKERPMSVSEIVQKTKEEQSAVSHNLKHLFQCHIVNFEKKGKERIYKLNEKTVKPLIEIVEKHINSNCCKDCNKNCKGCK